ncbi:Magnesium transporter MgtE [Aquisphaera giovannonii]|uniref:Magnesium transporter MgtE n=1 Tax=Aquisphaera giovannonii TaxID=406548 RepID=A0A5B9W1H0_9BACT|nr:magnesium transporter [Aquisphaera giovannonii]QEH34107.1 Magnesium transporter MgtE [Aquisphaera giovannonii]
MLGRLVLPEIKELIAEGDERTLREVVNGWYPADVATVVGQLDAPDRLRVLRILEPGLAADTFAYLDRDTQVDVLGSVSRSEAAWILNTMPPDDRTAFLEDLPPEQSERWIGLLDPVERQVARSLLNYEEDSVGRLMTPDYIAVSKEWTIAQVLDFVRAHGRDSETLNVIYVVDAGHHLIDDLRIREILLAPVRSRVEDICDRKYVSLKATEERKRAVDVFRKYDRVALPVTDAHGRLVGIVTLDDVLDVAEEEATREIQQFGGLEALDEPYMSTPLPQMVRKRATWLVILFVGEMLTATAMGFFEAEISKAVVLALFVPLIISSGGNSGSQAATLIIRALALGEVRLRDWFLVVRRELLSGLLLGLILGTIGFLRIALWSAFSTIYGEHWLLVGVTVACSLLGIVLWGTITGSMLPFLLKRLGLDPATSSAPFVATLVDVTGLVIYFSVAMVILRGTLL